MELSQTVHLTRSGSYSDVSPSSSTMAHERFSIIDAGNEDDTAALDKVKGQLSPQGFIANLVDKVWNRGIAAMFSTEQRQLNAARNLLAKPSQELTKAMNHFASLSSQVQRFGGAAITLDNVEQYAAALKAGTVLVEVPDEKAPNGVKLESQEPKLDNEINELRFARLSDGIRITDLEGLVAGMMTSKTPMTLTTAAKAVAVWNKAIQTAGKDLSDAEFRGLVTQANANAEEANANRKFVEANTVTTWAQIDGMGQDKFVNEAVAEFSEAVKGIDREENHGELVIALIEKVNVRTEKIVQILGKDTNYKYVKQDLLNSMNSVPGFKEALMEAQDSLTEVVTNNKNHEFLAREQITHLKQTQGEVIDSVKESLTSSDIKGEAAIAGTFAGLLSPNTAEYMLKLVGREDAVKEFPTVANAAVRTFNRIDEQLNSLLTQGNAERVTLGQETAEGALRKLEIINKLISNENKDGQIVTNDSRTWAIDTSEETGINTPIPKYDLNARAVAGALKEDFLTMIERLAGETDADSSPTLLKQVLTALEDSGRRAVLGYPFNPEDLFVDQTTDRNEPLTIDSRTMQKFAGEKPVDGSEDDARPIGKLRAVIKDIRQREEDDRIAQQQREMEEALLQRESNPTHLTQKKRLSANF